MNTFTRIWTTLTKAAASAGQSLQRPATPLELLMARVMPRADSSALIEFTDKHELVLDFDERSLEFVILGNRANFGFFNHYYIRRSARGLMFTVEWAYRDRKPTDRTWRELLTRKSFLIHDGSDAIANLCQYEHIPDNVSASIANHNLMVDYNGH